MTTYSNAIAGIDPLAALALLELKAEQIGSYIYYPCPDCQGKAVVKAWGEKKNQTFCTKCKKGGHIISLAMASKKLDYGGAVLLLNKVYQKRVRLETELSKTYDLKYKEIEGITEETAQKLQIGLPQGKTMLSGCLTFAVYSGGKKVAYFGLKDGKPKFYHTFNLELYLYRMDEAQCMAEVILTDSMIECVKFWQAGIPAVCNFELPYLSIEQAQLLEGKNVIIKVSEKNKKEFSLQSTDWKFFHKFE